MRILKMFFCIICLCWAYAYKLFTHEKHSPVNHGRMLRIGIYSILYVFFYVQAEHKHTKCMRKLSIGMQIVGVCWEYVYKSWAYAQFMCSEKTLINSVKKGAFW